MSIINNVNLNNNNLLINNINKFYNNNKEYWNQFLKIITGESKISLRVIDWYVTNYCKLNRVVYLVYNNNKLKRFNVYKEYKLELDSYSKKNFDPFCRRERIKVNMNNDKYIETTLGQLVFFRWLLPNNILEHIEKDFDIIISDMNARNSTSLKKRDKINMNANKTRKKREELSISAVKNIKKEYVEIILSFN